MKTPLMITSWLLAIIGGMLVLSPFFFRSPPSRESIARILEVIFVMTGLLMCWISIGFIRNKKPTHGRAIAYIVSFIVSIFIFGLFLDGFGMSMTNVLISFIIFIISGSLSFHILTKELAQKK